MKIGLLTNRFPPTLDGVGDYSYHLATELQRQGHTIAVLCRREAVIDEAVQRGGFPVAVNPNIPAWNWLAIKPLLAFMKQHRPDWLLVQYVPDAFQRWAMPIWLPMLMWLVQREGVRVCITFHEVSIRRRVWPLKYALVSLTQRFVAWALARLANEVVTSIDCYARQIQGYTSKPVHLIPIGSNIPPIPLSDADLALTRQHIVTNDGPVIATFGIRNQDLLFRVAEHLLTKRPHFNLLIVGKLSISALIEPLYQQLRERVYLTGYVSEAEAYRYLKASDVFFIPDPVTSNGEGGSSNKSTSLAAGLAAGLPVVGIRGDMNNDLLRYTPGLFLEDGADPAGIAVRLDTLLLANASVASRQETQLFFARHLSWKVIASQYSKALGWPQSKQHDYTSTW